MVNLKLFKGPNLYPHFNRELFQNKIEKYGNKEFFNEKEVKAFKNSENIPKIIGFISKETSKNYKNWLIENPGKLYIVSWNNMVLYFFPFGFICNYRWF